MKSVPDEKPDRAAGFVSSFPVANLSGIRAVTVTLHRYKYGIPVRAYRMNTERFYAIFIPIGE